MGNSIDDKKREIRQKINNNAYGEYESYNELDNAVRKALNDEESEYLKNGEINTFYKDILYEIWNQMEKKRERENKIKMNILTKLNLFYQDESCDSKEELEKKIKDSFLPEEKYFLEKPDIESQLSSLLNNFEARLKAKSNEEEEKKKIQLKYNIINKLNTFYQDESCITKEEFEYKIKLSLTSEEKDFFNDSDIKNQITIIWNNIESRKKRRKRKRGKRKKRKRRKRKKRKRKERRRKKK